VWRPARTTCIWLPKRLPRRDAKQMRAANSQTAKNCEKLWQDSARGQIDLAGDRPFTLSSHNGKRLHEGSFRTAWVVLQACQSRAADVDRSQQARISHCSISHAGWQQRRLDWLVVTRARVKLPWDTMRISLFSIPTWNPL